MFAWCLHFFVQLHIQYAFSINLTFNINIWILLVQVHLHLGALNSAFFKGLLGGDGLRIFRMGNLILSYHIS